MRKTHPPKGKRKRLPRTLRPHQIKERILWIHLQAIVIRVVGDTPRNRRAMNRFMRMWKKAEREENLIQPHSE